jgi:hypothetical protein
MSGLIQPSRCPLSYRHRRIADGDVLRLTVLVPVEMILDEPQPTGLQFEALRKSFPLDWQYNRTLCTVP